MFQQTLKQIYLFLFVIQTIVQAQNISDSDEMFDIDNMDNPEETGPYLEGDIKGAAADFFSILRNGVVSTAYRWPQAIVPYEIEGNFATNELSIISHAFNEYHTKTCVRFRKRTNEKDYIVLTNKPTGCWASLGRMGGRQEVNLESRKCFFNYGTSMHELMHALGFYHEQNRFERDSYVKVITENIKPNMLVNFGKLPHSAATAYGVPYDYASIMHYRSTSFSKNGKPTLEALQATPEALKMGQRHGFSKGDILKIKAMYRCQ
ncbi:hypothetical protein FF38_00332 [Lucilia cuprina]|uniref:Metalloendopeptidase n=1 Tax=Lucilia cuprina TaxID=7375 RepID=A0A0L0CB47_LUCCU|nr:Zinc metalloproteinase nas-8 [Lucilia cuprina]KNC29445.1 hypothetical protein FF38_00332 [Lucilia cuprina]